LNNNLSSKEIKLKLHNYTEDLVIDKLKELLEQDDHDDVCKCDKCVLDMCTFALNRLSPQYVVSHKGEVFTKINDFNQQSKVDVMATVAKAIEVVSKNPHEEEKD
jgi:competence protein ComFB